MTLRMMGRPLAAVQRVFDIVALLYWALQVRMVGVSCCQECVVGTDDKQAKACQECVVGTDDKQAKACQA